MARYINRPFTIDSASIIGATSLNGHALGINADSVKRSVISSPAKEGGERQNAGKPADSGFDPGMVASFMVALLLLVAYLAVAVMLVWQPWALVRSGALQFFGLSMFVFPFFTASSN